MGSLIEYRVSPRSGRCATKALPQAESLQLLARLEAEQLAVDLAARAQYDFAQHLDTFSFGPGISLEGNMLRQSLYRLLIVPVIWGIRHMTGRFLAARKRRASVNMVTCVSPSEQSAATLWQLALDAEIRFPHCSYEFGIFLTLRDGGMYVVVALSSQ